MVNIPEALGYVATIQGLDVTDPLEGGLDGALSTPLKQLASRTKWLKDALEAMSWQAGDIKEIACDAAYIAANFDGTGLGTNDRLGWAICNGANGTIDKGGKVGVGHGNGYTVGQTGGSKDAVVVSHSHKEFANVETNINSNRLSNFPNRQPALRGFGEGSSDHDYTLGSSTTAATAGNTSTEGVSGVNKNMQPYVVTLFIQKL